MYKAFKASHPESKRQATLSEYLLILQKLMSSAVSPLFHQKEAICRSCYFYCWWCNIKDGYFLHVDSYPSFINLLIVSDVKSPSLAEIVSWSSLRSILSILVIPNCAFIISKYFFGISSVVSMLVV